MNLMMDVVRAVRNARAEYNVTPGRHIAATIVAGDREAVLRSQAPIICALARLEPAQLSIVASGEAPAQAVTLVAGTVTMHLPLSGLVDLDAERQRLQKELAEAQGQIERAEKLLNGSFAQRAPANVVQREREKLSELQVRADALRGRLADLV